MRTQTEINEDRERWAKSIAVESGAEAIAKVISTMESALREFKRYAVGYEAAPTLALKAAHLNWTLNHAASNILGNMRLDLLASAQATLLRASDTAKEGK